MELRNILVPLDGSRLAEGVLPYAETLARLTNAHLRLLWVRESLSTGPWSMTDTVQGEMQRTQQETAQRYLDGVVHTLAARCVTAAGRVLMGEVAESIIEAEQEQDVDLAAMSTHGRSGVTRMLLGSIADQVMRHGTRPTLLVRSADVGDLPRPAAFRRVLVPLDGSELAEQALPVGEQLADAAGATLVLVRVERCLGDRTAGYKFPVVPDDGGMDDEVTASIACYLEGVKTRLLAKVNVELSPCRGDPAIVLEEFALKGGIDLVVMTTHGRGGVRRLTVGSMADRIVHLGVPTLLVRPSASTS